MDKAPLMVVASCSRSLHGGTKLRKCGKLVDGKMHVQYSVDQPAMHARSRNNFNAFDVMNRLSQGPSCLSDAWQTYNVRCHTTLTISTSFYFCEQVEVTCEPMHIRGAFKEPVASFFDIFSQAYNLRRSLAFGISSSLQACQPVSLMRTRPGCRSTI
jgi:hypothetical protein